MIQNNSGNRVWKVFEEKGGKLKLERRKKKTVCGVSFSGFGAKWDVCPKYHLWEPVRQVCAALLLIYFNAVLLTTFRRQIYPWLTSFSWCFVQVNAERSLLCRFFTCSRLSRNWSVKGLAETLLGNQPGASGFSRTSSALKTTERSENIWKRCGYGYIGALIPATVQCASDCCSFIYLPFNWAVLPAHGLFHLIHVDHYHCLAFHPPVSFCWTPCCGSGVRSCSSVAFWKTLVVGKCHTLDDCIVFGFVFWIFFFNFHSLFVLRTRYFRLLFVVAQNDFATDV